MYTLEEVINSQKDKNQPIYVIAKYYLGAFSGIKAFTIDGNKTFVEAIKETFMKLYACKNGNMGVTEFTYKLLKIDVYQVLNEYGEEIKNDDK